MQIKATNRYNGKSIIAKLREKPKVKVKKKKQAPITNYRNVV